jgi:ferredoxin
LAIPQRHAERACYKLAHFSAFAPVIRQVKLEVATDAVTRFRLTFHHRLRSINMPIVKFIKENKEIEVPHGANLRKEAIKAGVNVHQGVNGIGASLNKFVNCHGLAQCGTCRVKVTKGMENTSPIGLIEKVRFYNPLPDPIPCLSYIGNEDTMRLSCCVNVLGDIEVETGPPVDLFGENFFS